MCYAMYEHLESLNPLSNSQHGFRSKRSTTAALLYSSFKNLREIECKCDVDVILFDFSKAFDVVNHSLLLN